MFRDRPATGFGPGTYLNSYAKYQVTTEMTRISTNHGEKGNAHSEYLMYLSETGLPGLIIFLITIFFVIAKAIRIFNTSKDIRLKWLSFSILMGFLTYLIHGLFNSFIDTDKAAILFYAAIAAIVSIDLYHNEELRTVSGIVNHDPGKQADISTKNPG
jgi:O-antigen ligase